MKDINKFPKDDLINKINIISGPCSLESEEQGMDTAKRLSKIGIKLFRAGVWKPRTYPGGFEGIGPEGLPWLLKIKEKYGMKIAIEVATPAQCAEAKYIVDIFWIGARTTGDVFAVQSLADWFAKQSEEFKKTHWIFIKNPLSPDLQLWLGAVQRFYNAGYRNIAVIHRGFTVLEKTIYRNDPQWEVPISLREQYPNISIFCDPSHITGDSSLISSVSQQALDLGFDGLMIESHCCPEHAMTDAKQQITPETLEYILDHLIVRDNHDSLENIKVLRNQIDVLDDDLMKLLSKRFKIVREIGKYKKENNIPIVQSSRFDEINQIRAEQAHKIDVDPAFVRKLFATLQHEAIKQQLMM